MKLSTKLHREQFGCADLVKCVFDLSETDINILQNLPEDDGITSKHMAKIIGKDRSTVYRSLEKLITCQLCFKERKGKADRGFEDWYYLVPKQEILRVIEHNLDECYADVKKMLKQLDTDAAW